jgi:hypothetical protein
VNSPIDGVIDGVESVHLGDMYFELLGVLSHLRGNLVGCSPKLVFFGKKPKIIY